ncbi:protein-export chaperone SecB [Sphingomonas sinipercae]|uniref:Protein-export protein SecB n=1 Tax=Sphingomonas sinipercae TaxID=2714944 RepID=A0A6G7ZMM3_9SPHN|nr:protein-export chaperone SecB [Sphingomonas sinipercae]QIL02168.1 protein-export chaperone SecB [Sphingomonas sinipercae]
MADQDPNPAGNGADGAEDQPQVATIAQYVKDLSVESPSSPQVFQWQEQPGLDVQFQLNVNNVQTDVHEVSLKIEVKATSAQGTHFLVDLTYAGLFGIRNLPEEAMAPFLLIEAPRLLFPFARQIVADSIQNTGFAPLLLDPIDFAAAYMNQVQAQQGEGAGGGATPAVEGSTDA